MNALPIKASRAVFDWLLATGTTRVLLLGLVLFVPSVSAQPPTRGTNSFLDFVRARAKVKHSHDSPPDSLDAWQRTRDQLRERLREAWGGFPTDPCPLNPQKLGELPGDGYRIEKIIFQTRPDVWMTANAYVPETPGKHPAVLCVHGHWRGAKQDPVVQSRCIGLVKHGFFVLVVDAFGAGERGVGKALGEYHGEMTAATLFPVGLPLSGLQVYENMRAVDYLQSRPEVDGERIGITGASGGGNQTMYAGAMDDRFRAVVPVCSVGNYQAYLGAACCMCEVVPGALQFTEEWGVLSLTAPRALMIINATRDAPQFSVAEAKKSVTFTQPVFNLYGNESYLQHAIFESPHDYNRAMREAMYGWMKHHLADAASATPLPEPELKTLDPETLRCFPRETRPDDFMTIPKFAAREARRIVAQRIVPQERAAWERQAEQMRKTLLEKILGGPAPQADLRVRSQSAADGSSRRLEFISETGIELTARQQPARGDRVAIVLDLTDGEKAAEHALAAELRRDGWSVVTLDLRATGALAHPSDKIGRAPDHTTAEWAMWIGRPLLGQWVTDVQRTLDAVAASPEKTPREIAVVGLGPAGLVAICAATLDARINRVAAVNLLASFVSDVPYQGQRLGILAPGILRDVGDIAHLASLIAPRRLVLAGGVSSAGKSLSREDVQAAHQSATSVWKLFQAEQELRVVDPTDPAAIVSALK